MLSGTNKILKKVKKILVRNTDLGNDPLVLKLVSAYTPRSTADVLQYTRIQNVCFDPGVPWKAAVRQ